jgi:hypothetical protein
MSEEVGYIVGDKGPGAMNHYATRDLGWQRMGRDSWRDDEERLIRYAAGAAALKDAVPGARVYFPDCTSVSMHQEVYEECRSRDLELHLV